MALGGGGVPVVVMVMELEGKREEVEEVREVMRKGETRR